MINLIKNFISLKKIDIGPRKSAPGVSFWSQPEQSEGWRNEEPRTPTADELTDFVGRSRLCRSKAEGNPHIISTISILVVSGGQPSHPYSVQLQ